MATPDEFDGIRPRKTDDGTYDEQQRVIAGWWVLNTDSTVENILTGDTYDLSNIGSGGSASDTRTDVSDDGSVVVSDTEDINFGSLLSVAADGDGSVTVSGTDSRTDVSDDGSVVVSDAEDINFGSELTVTDDGDGTVSVTTADDVVRTRMATIPLTEIADTNTAVGLRILVPSGKTLKILEVGVEDDTGAAPAGLTIDVRDLTNAVDIVSQNSRHTEGSPIASKAGAIDVAFRVANATGGAVNASGYVLYTME